MCYALLHVRLLLIAAAFVFAIAQVSLGQQVSRQSVCHEIAVIGAVKRPQRLEARAGIRLLELLTKVGGPSERAGSTVQVLHSNCDVSESRLRDTYHLADVRVGRADVNPVLSAGDIVVLPEADSVFVFGNVRKPQTIVLTSPTTLRTAIAAAGGVTKPGDLVTVRISRRLAPGRRETIVLSFNLVLAGHGEDKLLQPWDIIEVSDEFGNFNWPAPLRPIWDPPLRSRMEISC